MSGFGSKKLFGHTLTQKHEAWYIYMGLPIELPFLNRTLTSWNGSAQLEPTATRSQYSRRSQKGNDMVSKRGQEGD